MTPDSQLSFRLIEALRDTLAEVEQTPGVAPDDPSLAALKGILLAKIADLEAQRAMDTATSEAPASAAPPALDSLPAITSPSSDHPE